MTQILKGLEQIWVIVEACFALMAKLVTASVTKGEGICAAYSVRTSSTLQVTDRPV